MLQSLLNAVPSTIGPWIYVLVFAAATSEAALLLGLIVPGETVLVVAGVLAARGQGNVWLYIAAALFGAIAGDSIGYELGRHLGPRLRSSAFGRRIGEQRWSKAEQYLHDKGGRAIFFGRWLAVVRAIVPALAGQARVPYRRFLIWNVAGAIPLAVVHVGLGYVAGQSYTTIDRYLHIGRWAAVAVVVTAAAILYQRRHAERPGTPAPVSNP